MLMGILTALVLTVTYPRAMEIVEIADDEVICVDAVGFEWGFYGADDFEVGDIVICTMDTKGTDTILDDAIVDVVWSGYTVADFYKPLTVRAIEI